ncbi:DUF7373 family lipoprotein [Nocardia wallacei]|uniref:DUF7373 family lipoprotein n=1 Tax=Nocardia wallacei TaxID=480035 RepID=UPI002458DF08|nr:hypothetical protein [Nocardia wallacei]
MATILATPLAAITLAGCTGGSTGTPQAAEIDVRTLEVGQYNTRPNDLRFEYSPNLDQAKQLAVARLADSVALGVEVDPKLAYGSAAQAVVNPKDAISSKYLSSYEPVLTKYGMLYGFIASSRDTKTDKGAVEGDSEVTIEVFQFPNENAAKEAAREYEQVDFDIAKDVNSPVTLPKYPQALSHWRPGIRTLGSRIAHGSYVLDIFVRTPAANLSDLIALMQRAYDVQLPMLSALPPLSGHEILHLPYDPEAILRRVLHPMDYDGPHVPNQMSAKPRAFLHFVADTTEQKAIFDAAGVDLFGVVKDMKGDTLVARARDAKSAQALAEKLPSASSRRIEPPRGVPDSSCTENVDKSGYSTDNRYRCLVRYGRYVARVNSSQPLDVYQRAAAQYALFANNSW